MLADESALGPAPTPAGLSDPVVGMFRRSTAMREWTPLQRSVVHDAMRLDDGRPLLLGVSGKARAGKDTLFETLVEKFGERNVRRLAFADRVRAEAGALPPDHPNHWDGIGPPYTPAGRTALQMHGMEKRAENPNYWIEEAFRFMDAENAGPNRPRIWVMTDVRFKNEADAVRARGGHIVRVHRVVVDAHGEPVPFDNGMTALQRGHPSETEMDTYPWDVAITNVTGQLQNYRDDVLLNVQALMVRV